jgi:predicted neutral ceramidase superfamily lipid hydrolase
MGVAGSQLSTIDSQPRGAAAEILLPTFLLSRYAAQMFRRWAIAVSLFVLHAAFVVWTYISWATSTSIERGMKWMGVFLIDFPSSYLFIDDRPDSKVLYAVSAILIGGLQWALVGAVVDLVRRALTRRSRAAEQR